MHNNLQGVVAIVAAVAIAVAALGGSAWWWWRLRVVVFVFVLDRKSPSWFNASIANAQQTQNQL